jgi:hypothetical protein
MFIVPFLHHAASRVLIRFFIPSKR